MYKSNSGCVSIARNLGIEKACGNYLLFVDSDDYLLPNALTEFYKAVETYANADFIQAPFGVLTNEKFVKRADRFHKLEKYLNKQWKGHDYLIKMGFDITYPWNSLVRRSFLIDNNLQFKSNIKVQEDLIYIIEIFAKGANGVLLSKPSYVYRWGRPNSLTSCESKLSELERRKRKDCLISMIYSTQELISLRKEIPKALYETFDMQISHNLTGIVGGLAMLGTEKEIFNQLKNKFPQIPVAGSMSRKLFALLYNLSPNMAYYLRKLMFLVH